jgi:hypothetical protein
MKLMEVVKQLHCLGEDLTIYVQEPWALGSEAALAPEPDDVLVPHDLATHGFSYFIEVFIATEIVPDLALIDDEVIQSQWCQRLIQYAETDA